MPSESRDEGGLRIEPHTVGNLLYGKIGMIRIDAHRLPHTIMVDQLTEILARLDFDGS